MFFFECVARVPVSRVPVSLGVWGLRLCAPHVAQPFATVRNRPQPSAWGLYGRAYGEFCKSSHFWKFQTLHSLVSRARRGTSWHSNMFHNVSKVFLCGMPGRRGLFASVSEDDYHFSVQHFGCVHVHVAWHAQNFRRVVLRVFANCIVRAASSGDNVQTRGRCGTSRECHFAWQGQYLVQIHCVWISFCMAGAVFRTLYTLHSALCTDTPHSTTLYTPHFTLYTLHSTLYTLHFTLNTLHPALYTPHFTLYTPQLTIYTLHSTLYTPHSRVYTLHSKFYTLHSTLHILHSTLYTLHSTIPTSHSTHNIPHSTFHFLHAPHFALHSLPHSTVSTVH